VTLRFPNGGIGQLHLSSLDPHKVRRMTVVGDRGMAVFDANRIVVGAPGENQGQGNQVSHGFGIVPNADCGHATGAGPRRASGVDGPVTAVG